jgi:hypothetical protein
MKRTASRWSRRKAVIQGVRCDRRHSRHGTPLRLIRLRERPLAHSWPPATRNYNVALPPALLATHLLLKKCKTICTWDQQLSQRSDLLAHHVVDDRQSAAGIGTISNLIFAWRCRSSPVRCVKRPMPLTP